MFKSVADKVRSAYMEDQLPLLKQKAGKGNVVAMTTLAMTERLGKQTAVDTTNGRRIRIDPDLAKSIQWYRKASDLGFPIAQTELAEMLYRGRETDMDKDEAVRLLTLASQANYPRAKIDLAQIGAETTRSPEALEALMRTMMKSTQSMFIQSQEPQGSIAMPGRSEAARK